MDDSCRPVRAVRLICKPSGSISEPPDDESRVRLVTNQSWLTIQRPNRAEAARTQPSPIGSRYAFETLYLTMTASTSRAERTR
jgi:hypothetical protein